MIPLILMNKDRLDDLSKEKHARLEILPQN